MLLAGRRYKKRQNLSPEKPVGRFEQKNIRENSKNPKGGSIAVIAISDF